MAEKSKLKWLRKEFGSSEELEYYLAQLKHQDKLKSDIISLLQRFQHLLFASYEPDYLTITYNGQWDVAFGPIVSEALPTTEPTPEVPIPAETLPKDLNDKAQRKTVGKTNKANKAVAKTADKTGKTAPNSGRATTALNSPTPTAMPSRADVSTTRSRPATKSAPAVTTLPTRPERVDLKTLLQAELISVGARLKHKTQTSIVATVTREGHLKIGKNEFQSLSGAATSFANSGRRDGWLCWLFQDEDGDWKPIDLLRERWRAEQENRLTERHQSA